MTKKIEKSGKFDSTRRSILKMVGGSIVAMPLAQYAFASGELSGSVGGSGTIRYALSAFPPNINPWDNTGSAAAAVKLTIMRGLTGFDANGKVVSELAESWTQSDDLTYKFKIRENAVFHNGKPVTSKDVEYSFKKILADDSTAWLKRDLSIVEKIEILDAKTFNIKLSQKTTVLLELLACGDCPIISADSIGEDYIGAGPFIIKGQERGVFIEVERFDHFYKKGAPNLKTVRFITYSDESLRYAALEAGDVDIIEYVPWQKFDEAEASKDINLLSALGPFMFLLFNCTKGPFKNPKVRQAIGYAIKRQDVIDGAFEGRGKPLYGFPNPEGSPFDLSDPTVQWSYDPEKAKALLAEAGYPNGFDCRLLATSTYGMHQDTAAIVQAYLIGIGINAQLVLPDWSSRITAGKNGDYDIAVHGTSGLFNDPSAVAQLVRTSEGSFVQSYGFESPRIDDLLAQAGQELDFKKRKSIYQQLAKAYFEDVPQIPLNWRQQGFATRSNVSGFSVLPGFENVQSAYTLDTTKID